MNFERLMLVVCFTALFAAPVAAIEPPPLFVEPVLDKPAAAECKEDTLNWTVVCTLEYGYLYFCSNSTPDECCQEIWNSGLGLAPLECGGTSCGKG